MLPSQATLSSPLSQPPCRAWQVGGLGDVVTGLAKACIARGHTVEIILPFYECLPEAEIEGLKHERDFDCPTVRALRWRAMCHIVVHGGRGLGARGLLLLWATLTYRVLFLGVLGVFMSRDAPARLH
jgi:hypothetical protein